MINYRICVNHTRQRKSTYNTVIILKKKTFLVAIISSFYVVGRRLNYLLTRAIHCPKTVHNWLHFDVPIRFYYYDFAIFFIYNKFIIY